MRVLFLLLWLFSFPFFAIGQDEYFSQTDLDKLSLKLENEFIHINSFLISEKGKIVFEKYGENDSADQLHQVCSVTKSITSLVIGIAIQQGLIKNVEQAIIDFFPEYDNEKLHPEFREIQIKHLLTMSPGFNINDTPFFDFWVKHPNPIAFSFGFRPDSIPGTFLKYNDVAIHVLSALIRNVSGKTLGEYANENLFEPLEIENFKWETDPQGNQWANFRSWFYPKDLLKFGQLVLNKGSWKGKQIIDPEYLRESTKTQITGELFGYTTNYGYLWYIGNSSGIKTINASGYGGQFIYIFPKKEIVVVCTSEVDRHYAENFELFRNFIIPLLK